METILSHLIFLEEIEHLRNLGVQVNPSLLLCGVVRTFRLTYGCFPDMDSLVLHHYHPCSDSCEYYVPMEDAIPIVQHGVLTFGTFLPCPLIYQFHLFQFTEGRYPRLDELQALQEGNGIDLTPLMHQNVDEYWEKKESGVAIHSLTATRATQQASDPCAICQEEINVGDEVITLSCKHTFHSESETCSGIREWVRRVNSCPLCKKEIQ
jgi:hypothetical protein